MEDTNEKWVPVIDYVGLYEVSNLGRVKSLPKSWVTGYSTKFNHNGKILKTNTARNGYLYVSLCKDGKQKTKKVHRLVWESFNGKTTLHIDHKIEGNKKDNSLSNLQPLSLRENIIKYVSTKSNRTSLLMGVSRLKTSNTWRARISINGKEITIGCYKTEIEASIAYQNKLQSLTTTPAPDTRI